MVSFDAEPAGYRHWKLDVDGEIAYLRLDVAEDGRLTRVMLTADGESRLRRLGPAHLDELRNLAPVLDQLVSEWAAHTEQQSAPGPG